VTPACRIDAHHHLWRIVRGDYGWLSPADKVLYRDCEPQDFKAILDSHGISHSVLIQAASTDAETDFLLTLADTHDFIAAVVGWVDFIAPDVSERLAHLAQHPKFRGIRPMLQDIAETAWVVRPEFRDVFDALTQLGLSFDALCQPRHLPCLLTLSERHPDLAIAINHCGKPEIRDWQAGDHHFRAWADGMRQLAQNPHIVCKLSALPTRAAPGWNAQVFAPYSEVLFDAFGPKRLMWASDWPVLERNGDYHRWWQVAHELTPAADQNDVFGATARRFYRLNLS